jgi:hypothetical protein
MSYLIVILTIIAIFQAINIATRKRSYEEIGKRYARTMCEQFRKDIIHNCNLTNKMNTEIRTAIHNTKNPVI